MGYLEELADQIHRTAVEKGFWDHLDIDVHGGGVCVPNPSIWAEKLALIHSEVSEALDALRDGDEALAEEELADTIIRILDFAAARHWEASRDDDAVEWMMGKAIRKKMEKNTTRPHLHGRNF